MAQGQGASMDHHIDGENNKKVYDDHTLGYSQEEEFDMTNAVDPCETKKVFEKYPSLQQHNSDAPMIDEGIFD